MAKKTSWKRKAINSLIERGVDRANAERIWSSVYQAGRRRIRKETTDKNINVTYEAYRGIVGKNSLIDVNISNDFIQVKTTLAYKGENLEQAYINNRFASMADKYSKVAILLEQYNAGDLSYKEFINSIQKFKETDKDYIEGSVGSP